MKLEARPLESGRSVSMPDKMAARFVLFPVDFFETANLTGQDLPERMVRSSGWRSAPDEALARNRRPEKNSGGDCTKTESDLAAPEFSQSERLLRCPTV